MLRLHLFVVLNFFFCLLVNAQKETAASKIVNPIILDGEMSEEAWKSVQSATDFVINWPTPGIASAFKSEVKFAYDDYHIYIGAKFYDPKPDSIIHFLSERDDLGNADYFGVVIDTYASGQNAFGFFVSAAGTELDVLINQLNEDVSWNAVWRSQVKIDADGWGVEIKIPLTQLRFSKEEIQKWRINYIRSIRRNRETSFWSPVDPQQYGEIAQSGFISGIENLGNPLRLSFSPYTTLYAEDSYNPQKDKQEWGFRPRFGMDMKLGLSESFTLDATLVPDFGQTVSDRLVLNLSPFEVRYPENRPFFLEGMDLFGIGDLFYSRRIGDESYLKYQAIDSASAVQGSAITEIPDRAQLINALKISGRTKSGLGVGVFNAIENRSYLKYRDSLDVQHEILAHPITNYNVVVLSQNLKNNANVSFLNTNVLRPEINAVSNVTNLSGLVFTKERKYSFNANTKVSVTSQNQNTSIGRSSFLSFSKVKGVHLFNIDYYDADEKYNPTEMGFLANNNYQGIFSRYRWTGYEPTATHLRRTVYVNNTVEMLYKPSKFSYWSLESEFVGTTKNFLTYGASVGANPLGEYNYFESRVFPIPVKYPSSFVMGGFYSSNYAKDFALDFYAYYRQFNRKDMAILDLNVSPRIRFSPKIFMVVDASVVRHFNDFGFTRMTDPSYADQIILGRRNRWTVNNSIDFDYTFTKTFRLKLRFNHYWQEVNYRSFMQLQGDGSTIATTYSGVDATGKNLHHTSYNAFTVDFDLRWVVYPGSEIRFVWKYNIYASKNALDLSYFRTFNDLFENPYLNSFSIKALFYIDAGKWFKKKKKA